MGAKIQSTIDRALGALARRTWTRSGELGQAVYGGAGGRPQRFARPGAQLLKEMQKRGLVTRPLLPPGHPWKLTAKGLKFASGRLEGI